MSLLKVAYAMANARKILLRNFRKAKKFPLLDTMTEEHVDLGTSAKLASKLCWYPTLVVVP